MIFILELIFSVIKFTSFLDLECTYSATRPTVATLESF